MRKNPEIESRVYQYDYKPVYRKGPKDPKDRISNFIHPAHLIFTYEYGWMRIDQLFAIHKEGRQLNIMQFDLMDWKMYYTTEYKILRATVTNAGLYNIKRKKNIRGLNDANLLIYKFCETIVSIDGENLKRVRAIDLEHLGLESKTLNKMSPVNFVNLETVRSFHRGDPEINFVHNLSISKIPFTGGMMYGLVNQTGAMLSMLDGQITLLGCYDFGYETPTFWK